MEKVQYLSSVDKLAIRKPKQTTNEKQHEGQWVLFFTFINYFVSFIACIIYREERYETR